MSKVAFGGGRDVGNDDANSSISKESTAGQKSECALAFNRKKAAAPDLIKLILLAYIQPIKRNSVRCITDSILSPAQLPRPRSPCPSERELPLRLVSIACLSPRCHLYQLNDRIESQGGKNDGQCSL